MFGGIGFLLNGNLLVGVRKGSLVLRLGPEPLDCLYSVFMAKLVRIRRHALEQGGALKLCDVHPHTRRVFEACHLDKYFDFAPDQETAVAALANRPPATPSPVHGHNGSHNN